MGEIFADVPMASDDGAPAPADEDDTNALDELIAGAASLKPGLEKPEQVESLTAKKEEKEEDEDPLMDTVKAAASKRVESSQQLKVAKEEASGTAPPAAAAAAAATAGTAPKAEGENAMSPAAPTELLAESSTPGSSAVKPTVEEESKETIPMAVPGPPATKLEESSTSVMGTPQASKPVIKERFTS